MNAPFPLLAAALLLWGWRADQWEAAVIMALLLEGSRVISWRWHPLDQDLHRVGDLGTLILVGLLAYPHITGTRDVPVVLYEMQILPYALFPLMLAQAYATRRDYPLGGLFYAMRKDEKYAKSTIQIDYLFFGTCLIAASASVERSPWYFPATVVLLGLALWPHRPRRYNIFAWLLALVLAAGFAYQQQRGMVAAQRLVGDQVGEWLSQWFMRESDPHRRNTALGDVGELKLSESILYRVDQPHPWTMPLLLREGSYNNLVGKMWFGPTTPMRELPVEARVGSWTLVPQAKKAATLVVLRSFGGSANMVAAPQGTTALTELPAIEVDVNAFGSIKVKNPPPYVAFKIHYDPDRSFDAPPEEVDLSVPAKELAAVQQVAEELGLAALPAQEILTRIERFFIGQFRYTVTLTNKGRSETPIGRFLLENRAGHCEYFASGTVLLLRQAGIPARYVFGYSVHEPEGKVRVVRRRHAHAWASAYIDGVWRDVDNTPPDWQGLEEENAPWWQQLPDLWSRLVFEFKQYQAAAPGERTNWPWLALLALLVSYMAWRVVRGKGAKKTGGSAVVVEAETELLPFQQIEQHLAATGWHRAPGEPLGLWLRRIGHLELLPLLALHYRQRFDPLGCDPAAKKTLATAVAHWLAQQSEKK